MSPVLPTDSASRKDTPITTGFLLYFPRAVAYGARISVLGNDKHNPGEPLHWAEGKSMDHPDCIARHLVESGTFDPDDGALHEGKLFWRAAANLETALKAREAAGLPLWDEAIIAKNKATLAEKLATKKEPLADKFVKAVTNPEHDKIVAQDKHPEGVVERCSGTADCACPVCKPAWHADRADAAAQFADGPTKVGVTASDYKAYTNGGDPPKMLPMIDDDPLAREAFAESDPNLTGNHGS